ncbi:hypothetical protein FDG2_3470 [Candidatus Protofrankia californiensis]|uniref:Uncharacterized protein n=1 Tax=Candidatus Protofrankia californiensis TaxID=1839754 RepID=A0A1C3NZN1_9ACTN|nr:hypothetical protein FDG2_3470 [Candidatus Protofrankia californiensis]
MTVSGAASPVQPAQGRQSQDLEVVLGKLDALTRPSRAADDVQTVVMLVLVQHDDRQAAQLVQLGNERITRRYGV